MDSGERDQMCFRVESSQSSWRQGKGSVCNTSTLVYSAWILSYLSRLQLFQEALHDWPPPMAISTTSQIQPRTWIVDTSAWVGCILWVASNRNSNFDLNKRCFTLHEHREVKWALGLLDSVAQWCPCDLTDKKGRVETESYFKPRWNNGDQVYPPPEATRKTRPTIWNSDFQGSGHRPVRESNPGRRQTSKTSPVIALQLTALREFSSCSTRGETKAEPSTLWAETVLRG